MNYVGIRPGFATDTNPVYVGSKITRDFTTHQKFFPALQYPTKNLSPRWTAKELNKIVFKVAEIFNGFFQCFFPNAFSRQYFTRNNKMTSVPTTGFVVNENKWFKFWSSCLLLCDTNSKYYITLFSFLYVTYDSTIDWIRFCVSIHYRYRRVFIIRV